MCFLLPLLASLCIYCVLFLCTYKISFELYYGRKIAILKFMHIVFDSCLIYTIFISCLINLHICRLKKYVDIVMDLL